MDGGYQSERGAHWKVAVDGGWSRLVRTVAVLAVAFSLLAVLGGTPVTAQESGLRDGGPASIEVHLSVCAAGYTGTDFYADCHGNGVADVTVLLQSAANGIDVSAATEVANEPGPGIVAFDELPADDYTVTIDIPGDNNTFESYCAQGDETPVPVTPEDDKIGTFAVAPGQSVVCDWYVIPADQGQPDAASIGLDVLMCDTGFEAGNAGAADFADACTEPAGDVGFTLTDQDGGAWELRSDEDGTLAFADFAPGTYALVSEVPGESAREYLYCTADGGDIYQKEFNEVGATTFAGVTTEQIRCDWYIVPEDLRGASASLTVHLGVCPVGYDDQDFYADCHDEGAKGQEYYLEGPDGLDLAAMTSLPESPGPGVASFTELPAGDYSLFGGPPGDFVDIRVGCTDDTSDAQLDVDVADGRAALTIDDGQAVVCDWYAIPEDQGEPNPAPTVAATQPALTVTELPSTGAGEAPAGDGTGRAAWTLVLATVAAVALLTKIVGLRPVRQVIRHKPVRRTQE